MTDQKHIIELAKSCGVEQSQILHGLWFATKEQVEAFYHAARNEGLEAAKQACIPLEHYGEVSGILCVKAIEKLKE